MEFRPLLEGEGGEEVHLVSGFSSYLLNCKDCDVLYVGKGWFKPTERFLVESQIGWLVFQLSKPCAVLSYFGWWMFRLSTSSLSYFSGHIAIQSVDLRRRNEKKKISVVKELQSSVAKELQQSEIKKLLRKS